jgi:histidine triad (HIT) family protein
MRIEDLRKGRCFVSVDNSCLFCKIASGELNATVVYKDEMSLAFLDHRPLFPGHCLLIPQKHFETLTDLPSTLIGPFFESVQLLSTGIETAMGAEGTFVAMNNRVSQSVPHLHVHIVPRRRKDGLKGFFWPRSRYGSEVEIAEVQQRIVATVAQLQSRNDLKNKTHKKLI